MDCNQTIFRIAFFTRKGIITKDSITIEENGMLKTNAKETYIETTEVFNNCYVNTTGTTSGKWPSLIDSSVVKKLLQ